MNYRTLLSLAIIGVSLSLASISNAAITIVDTGGIAKTQGANSTITVTSTELGNFNANGSSKLVVTLSGERGGTGSYGHLGLTYGGVAMTQILATATDNAARVISMWYLDNVSVTGDFVVTFSANGSGIGLGAVALDGTANGVGASSFSQTGSSTTISTTAAGDFVMGAGMANGTTVTATSPLIQLFSGDTGSSTGASGYRLLSSTASTTTSFSGATGVAAASFTAIPEPSAALLGAIGSLLLLRRRRN